MYGDEKGKVEKMTAEQGTDSNIEKLQADNHKLAGENEQLLAIINELTGKITKLEEDNRTKLRCSR